MCNITYIRKYIKLYDVFWTWKIYYSNTFTKFVIVSIQNSQIFQVKRLYFLNSTNDHLIKTIVIQVLYITKNCLCIWTLWIFWRYSSCYTIMQNNIVNANLNFEILVLRPYVVTTSNSLSVIYYNHV